MVSQPTHGKVGEVGRRLVPEGELRCIWMTSGVLSYKLCDRQYDCEHCPLDAALRRQYSPTALEDRSPVEKMISGRTHHRNLDDEVCDLIKGYDQIRYPPRYRYHKRHTWTAVQPGQTLRIGIDGFLAKVLVRPKSIVLPSRGAKVSQGHYFCWLVEEFGTLPAIAPLSGTVTVVNAFLINSPGFVKQDPYVDGWLVEIQPEDLQGESHNLWDHRTAEKQFQRDVQRLKEEFLSELHTRQRALGGTLPDGGLVLKDLQEVFGSPRYFEIIRPFFR